jgi:hypothetical protein
MDNLKCIKMNKKSIFQVIIKTIGLLTLKEFIVTIPSFLSLLQYDTALLNPEENILIPVIMTLSIFIVYILIIYSSLFKTNFLIDKLKLVEDDNEVLTDWYFDIKTLVSLVIIVVGLNCIVEVLPTFIQQLIISLKGKAGIVSFFDGKQYPLLFPVVKLVLGFLLISNYRTVCNWIVKVSETKEDDGKSETTG